MYLDVFVCRMFIQNRINLMMQWAKCKRSKWALVSLASARKLNCWGKSFTVMSWSFRTDMPRQTVQTQIRLLLYGQTGLGKQCRPRSDCSWRNSLIRVYTVCNSRYIFQMHYSTDKSSCSTFWVITKSFLGVRIFRKFTVTAQSSVMTQYCFECNLSEGKNYLPYIS